MYTSANYVHLLCNLIRCLAIPEMNAVKYIYLQKKFKDTIAYYGELNV